MLYFKSDPNTPYFIPYKVSTKINSLGFVRQKLDDAEEICKQ